MAFKQSGAGGLACIHHIGNIDAGELSIASHTTGIYAKIDTER